MQLMGKLPSGKSECENPVPGWVAWHIFRIDAKQQGGRSVRWFSWIDDAWLSCTGPANWGGVPVLDGYQTSFAQNVQNI